MEELREDELAILIRPAGYYNNKARKLKEFLKYSGEITREGLLGIWGCGPETVDSILLYAYNMPVFVIDAYTKRILSRIGICEQDISYGGLQGKIHSELSSDYEMFNEYHALLVKHAKEHCKVKPVCTGCALDSICKKKKV